MFSEVGVPYNDKYIKVYEDYNLSIIKYFKENDLPLLSIDFENDDNIIEKVCEFLGIDHSNIIYKRKIDVPWFNKGGSYQDPNYWKTSSKIIQIILINIVMLRQNEKCCIYSKYRFRRWTK